MKFRLYHLCLLSLILNPRLVFAYNKDKTSEASSMVSLAVTLSPFLLSSALLDLTFDGEELRDEMLAVKEDAKDYLIGYEMTPALQETIDVLRTKRSSYSFMNDLEISAIIATVKR